MLTILMGFLYFPQDKAEYIPAFIMLVIFMVGATATMYIFYKKSKKEESYFDNKFNLKEETNHHHHQNQGDQSE